MKNASQAVLLAISLLMAGCAVSNPPGSFAPAAPVRTAGKLVLMPRVITGGYAVSSVLARHTVQSIDHLVIKLFVVDQNDETPVLQTDGAPVQVDLGREDLIRPLTMDALHAHRTYRVRAYAYAAPGTDASNLISVNERSYVDVAVNDNDQATMAPLTVTLADTPFGATAAVMLSATGSVFTSLELGFYALNGDAETLIATRSVRAEQMPNIVSFGNLHAMTTYRLKAQARDLNDQVMAGANTQLDIAVADDTAIATRSLVLTVP